MKKKLLVCVMALAAVVTVTGCEKKKEDNNGGETTTTVAQEVKLACEAKVDTDTFKINITYKEDKIVKASFTSIEKYATDAEAKKEYEKDSKEISETSKNKGVLGSSSYSGTLLTNNINFTISDLDDKGKELYDEIFGEVKDKSYEDAKNQLSSNGYTCN